MRFLKFFLLSLGLSSSALFSSLAAAQAAAPGNTIVVPHQFQIYAGYGYWNPLSSGINGHDYQPIENLNFAASVSYFFSRHVGVEFEAGYFSDNRSKYFTGSESRCAADTLGRLRCETDQTVNTLVAGPVYRRPIGAWIPYAHVMGGMLRMNGPVVNPAGAGAEIVAGAGVDYVFKFWNNHLAIRPIQIDGHFGHIDYGPMPASSDIVGGSASIKALHLSAGLVLRGGGGLPAPEQLLCSADPLQIIPGQPLHLAAVATGMGRHAFFRWTGPGISNGGGGASALDLSTAALQPGTYEVTVRASDGPTGRVRRTCTTGFHVHAIDPPTVGCRAQPETVEAGAPSHILVAARSPQNRVLTYGYTASAGTIAGDGPDATLKTAGVAPGPIDVTCNVTDDAGNVASAKTTVIVKEPTAPPPPPVVEALPAPEPVLPARQEIVCRISFAGDRRRPTRVDNRAKACLDAVALGVKRDSQNRLVIVGTYRDGETDAMAVARAENTKAYLVNEKGIDPRAIELMIRQSVSPDAENVLLPPGAKFDEPGAKAVPSATP